MLRDSEVYSPFVVTKNRPLIIKKEPEGDLPTQSRSEPPFILPSKRGALEGTVHNQFK